MTSRDLAFVLAGVVLAVIGDRWGVRFAGRWPYGIGEARA